jgi:hypothetical protein
MNGIQNEQPLAGQAGKPLCCHGWLKRHQRLAEQGSAACRVGCIKNSSLKMF